MNQFARLLTAADLIGLLTRIASPSPAEIARRKARDELDDYRMEEAFWDRQNGHGDDDE